MTAIEGKKIYTYYQTKNWKLSRGLKIKNGKETAKNYIEIGFEIKEQYTSPFSGYVDNLENNNNKDYNPHNPIIGNWDTNWSKFI